MGEEGRGCVSLKPSMPGPNTETCSGQSPSWTKNEEEVALALDHVAPLLTSEQGILFKSEEHYDSSLNKIETRSSAWSKKI